MSSEFCCRAVCWAQCLVSPFCVLGLPSSKYLQCFPWRRSWFSPWDQSSVCAAPDTHRRVSFSPRRLWGCECSAKLWVKPLKVFLGLLRSVADAQLWVLLWIPPAVPVQTPPFHAWELFLHWSLCTCSSYPKMTIVLCFSYFPPCWDSHPHIPWSLDRVLWARAGSCRNSPGDCEHCACACSPLCSFSTLTSEFPRFIVIFVLRTVKQQVGEGRLSALAGFYWALHCQ